MLESNELQALDVLLKCCHRRRYAAKSKIFRPGDPGDTLYYILEGSVAITMPQRPAGGASSEESWKSADQDVVITHLHKGSFLGEVNFFLGSKTYEVCAVAREQCMLASIAYSRLHRLLRTTLVPQACDILLLLGTQLSKRLLSCHRKATNLVALDVAERIAYTLRELCQEPDAMTHPDGMQIRITRQELGRLVGCSREMAGRVLKNLELEHQISAKGKTIVVYGTR